MKYAKTKQFLYSLCLGLALVRPASAWNGEGHMVVSQIAYNHLDPVVKARCDALIAVQLTYGEAYNGTFVTSACWADDYKSQLGTATLHYINLPVSLDGTSTSGVFQDPTNVVTAINYYIGVLQNANSAITNQAEALRYLIHFIGDIQQPLHCVAGVWSTRTSGDSGGNAFSLSGGQWSNLHSLWDSGGGFVDESLWRPLDATDQGKLDAKVAAVEAAVPFVSSPGTIPNAMTWAIEGSNVAKTVTYVGVTRNTTPTTNYLATVQATAKQRLAMGGKRLVDLLNTVFAPIALKSVVTNGAVTISWTALANQTYRVQWKAQLSDATWNDLVDVLAVTNSANFTEIPPGAQRYYRVVR